MNAIAAPPHRRRGPPPNASVVPGVPDAPDAPDIPAVLDPHERLARNRADPDHRPAMRPVPVAHPMARPAFPAVPLAVAVHEARKALAHAKLGIAQAKGKHNKASARRAVLRAQAALAAAQSDLAREVAGGEPARLAGMERAGRIAAESRDDPDDTNERAAKPRQVRGFRTACRVRFLLRRDKHGGLLRDAHVRAADALRLDWDIARHGLSGDPDAARTTSSGARTGPTEAEHARAAAARRFAAALRHVGQISDTLLRCVVLENWTVARWCDDRWTRAGSPEGKRPNETAALGLLIGALDRLAAHYEADEPRG